MSDTLLYLAAFVILVAAGVALSILAVRRDGRGVGDLLKQVVIWIGIVGLLPLVGYAGGTILHPQTPMKDLMAELNRVQQEQGNFNYDNNDPAARAAAQEQRSKLMDKQQELTKKIEEETRLFNRAQFWIAFPVGLVSILVGVAVVRIVCVGTSLAFGGLCALSFGCYSYWDGMGDYLRFFSLLIALVALIVLGLTKYGRSAVHAERELGLP